MFFFARESAFSLPETRGPLEGNRFAFLLPVNVRFSIIDLLRDPLITLNLKELNHFVTINFSYIFVAPLYHKAALLCSCTLFNNRSSEKGLDSTHNYQPLYHKAALLCSFTLPSDVP